MKFTPTRIEGVWIIDMERRSDARGWFARTWCEEELTARGLNPSIAQCSSSFNQRRGTLRGLHSQTPPHEEAKIVRCTRGAVHDVAVDLRINSRTYLSWVAVELTEDNGRMLYVPEGCAHGFQTLEDHTEVHYTISRAHSADHSRGVRWNDPLLAISWPLPDSPILNERDAGYPDLPSRKGQ